LYAEWLAMMLDCACEGKIGAQSVLWPEGEEAGVLFCDLGGLSAGYGVICWYKLTVFAMMACVK
jgi:hypothetical protein